MRDFFLTPLSKSGTIGLSTLVELAHQTSPSYFVQQINRFLSNHKRNTLVVTDGTSHPCKFSDLLKALSKDAIGKVELSSRDDVNSSIKGTISRTLWLAQGTLEIRPHWTARNGNRSEEVVSTLLRPLFENGLRDRTFIEDESSYSESGVTSFNISDDKMIADVCHLSGYRIESNESRRLIEYL